MVEHNEDPCSPQLEVNEDIYKRIIAGLYLILPVEPACCRHIGIRVVRGMIQYFSTDLSIKLPVCFLKNEKMLEIAGCPYGGKRKIKNLSVTALLNKADQCSDGISMP
jgi:hypothetical protein